MHVFGTNATDLVHIGQAIMGCGGTVDYLVDTVLNYPTLSEAYKVAALDVTNKMRALDALDGRRRLEARRRAIRPRLDDAVLVQPGPRVDLRAVLDVTSMCRCGPVDWPRLPTSAISWPASPAARRARSDG